MLLDEFEVLVHPGLVGLGALLESGGIGELALLVETARELDGLFVGVGWGQLSDGRVDGLLGGDECGLVVGLLVDLALGHVGVVLPPSARAQLLLSHRLASALHQVLTSRALHVRQLVQSYRGFPYLRHLLHLHLGWSWQRQLWGLLDEVDVIFCFELVDHLGVGNGERFASRLTSGCFYALV